MSKLRSFGHRPSRVKSKLRRSPEWLGLIRGAAKIIIMYKNIITKIAIPAIFEIDLTMFAPRNDRNKPNKNTAKHSN